MDKLCCKASIRVTYVSSIYVRLKEIGINYNMQLLYKVLRNIFLLTNWPDNIKNLITGVLAKNKAISY